MRRYAVRFLVAVLTFGIGVALSLALGLFRVQNTKFSHGEWTPRSSCSKKFRVARPAFVQIDSELGDPLKLVYLGSTPEHRMQFLVENRRHQTISGYSITAERIWEVHGRESETGFNWTLDGALQPGESRRIVLPRNADGVSLRVAKVTFQSGFTWINPRETR